MCILFCKINKLLISLALLFIVAMQPFLLFTIARSNRIRSMSLTLRMVQTENKTQPQIFSIPGQ